jgi:hypothetical protein
MMYSTKSHKLVTTLVFIGYGLGILALPDYAAATPAPSYKISMVKRSAESARTALKNGTSPDQDCTMVSMQGKSIITSHADDKEAVAVASEAMEICSFEVPVAYFGTMLDTVQEQLKGDPDDPNPCNDFVSAFVVYFNIAASPPPGAADSEARVKAALSDKAKEVCPLAAGMMKF